MGARQRRGGEHSGCQRGRRGLRELTGARHSKLQREILPGGLELSGQHQVSAKNKGQRLENKEDKFTPMFTPRDSQG